MKRIIFIIISLIILGCYDIDITVLIEDTDNPAVSHQIDDDYDAGDDGGN
jgi:hypothetical protein